MVFAYPHGMRQIAAVMCPQEANLTDDTSQFTGKQRFTMHGHYYRRPYPVLETIANLAQARLRDTLVALSEIR